MEKIGRKALFQNSPSNGGNNDGNIILEDWTKILKSAVEGDALARIDLDSIDGSLKPLGETLNSAIDKLAEVGLLRKQAESFIKQNPQAITVLSPDKSRIDLNKEYERVWRGGYEELMRKKLYDFDITMTGGEDFYASYNTKRLAISEMTLNWANGEKTYVRLYQVPILDDKGDILINYYIYQDLTKDVSVEKYLDSYVEQLKVNLEMFARGDLTFNSVVDEGNEYTTVVRDDFVRINESIDAVRDAVGSVLTDVGTLAKATVEGKLDTRMDASAHEGEFANVIEGINDTLDAMVGPLNVTAEYIDRISKGDIPEKVTDDMKGDFNEIKNNLNACIDAVDLLVADAEMLASAAAMEEFATRADVTKHNGDFRKVMEGMNQTFDGVAGKLYLYESSIDAIPFPVSVTDMDMNWIFFNKAVADMTGLRREDMLGKQCNNWNADICNTKECGVQMLRRGETTSFFKQPGMDMDMRVDTQYIQNATGEKIGHIEIIQDITAANRVTEFQKQEVARLTTNLAEIAKGNLNIDTTVTDGDKYTAEIRENFVQIKGALDETIAAVGLLVNDAGMLAEATVEGRLDTRADASKHQGDFRKIIVGVNDTLDAVVGPLNVAAEYVDRISKGDIPEKVTDDMQGDFNEIKNNLNQCIDALNLVTEDVGLLAEAGRAGTLDVRADPTHHRGVFAEYIAGLNETLDAVVGPLNVAAEYVDRISKGDIPEKVSDDMQGDFNEIKNNLNQCIDALNLVTEDVGLLVEAGATGDLSARADPARHQGVFAEFIIGFNNTLDASGAPLGETVSLLERMAVNDYTKRIETEYPGDYKRVTQSVNEVMGRLVNIQNTVQHISAGDLSDLNDYRALGKRSDNDMLNPSIIGMIESLQAVVNDANMLANAGVAGQLDVRADAKRHAGAYGEVIGGINNCLDAVIGPMNVAAEYVDRISKGDIPEKITDVYSGDFNEIKNNLNQCIDAVNLLISDAHMLADAGVAGQLDVRADVKRHVGAYGEVIGGINNCLDAIVGPLNVSAEYVDRISKGDIPEKITDAYVGDFNEIKNNLNGCIDAVNLLLADANTLAQAGVAGQLDVRADAKRHAGAYGEVIGGINNCLDAVIGPMNVAAEYVDRISKGDIPEKITDVYAGDFNEIKNNLNQCIDAVNLLISDAHMLANAGVAGQLDVRADAKRHAGAYGEVIGGINNCLDAVIGPMNVAAEYVDRISKGDIPEKITDAYVGDFNEIKNNLNQCIGSMNLLVEDAHNMAVAASEGRIDTRVDVSRHAGDYAKVMTGLNDSFEEIGRVLEITANFIEDVAKGNKISKITRDTKGEYLTIRDNINDSIDVIFAVTGEINKLTEAAVNGQLDTRGNTAEFPGVWGVIIGGINDSLDAVIGPLNVAAEYVDRISKGDIPDKVTDNMKGDFNEIKNNLNGCIDAVNLLVRDTNMLADAAAAGKLTARADISQHAGDYAKIVEGINQTLDVINAPFREMNSAIAQLDVTADETTRGADEIAKAAGQVAVTSQQCADLSSSLIIQIEKVNGQVSDLSASNEEIASTSQEVYKHAVQTADIGENAQKLGAEANIKMNIVEGIAKQSVDEMENLNSRMKEINNVVSQVNDITNQINLLALNAAIEAARAGEHGRGFAVVAGEVRNLAEEAKKATGQIDQVIAGVQAISAKTAEGIGSAHAEIGSGVASVNATIEALNEIVQGSQDMKINMDEIAKAVEEQAVVANHIVEAMEESNRLTRENQGQIEELASLAEEASASTEEIGSSIHEVKNMAGNLRQTMDKFEI